VPTANDTTVSGSCTADDHTQSLKLRFHPRIENKTVEGLVPWALNLVFAKNISNKAFALSSITLTAIFDGYFDDAKEFQSVYTSNANQTFIGAVAIGKSFKCSSEDEELIAMKDMATAKVQLIDYRVIAFKQDNSTVFPSTGYELCDKDVHTSDIVPIVVGACLAGLVIIVLIAYLIGRARAKRQGYASV
jgi:lysosomal-associated membrane protein 1/2